VTATGLPCLVNSYAECSEEEMPVAFRPPTQATCCRLGLIRVRRLIRPRPCLRSIIGHPRITVQDGRRLRCDTRRIVEAFTRGERHRRLFARLLIAFGLSTVVFAVSTVLVWIFESGQKGGNIHGLGDSAFFCAV